MSCIPLLLVTIAAVLISGGAQRHDVACPDQQEVCECLSTADECHFTLEVEELQTFTSYSFLNGSLMTRGTPGDVYNLNQGRFSPSLLDQVCGPTIPPDDRPPECGRCWNTRFQQEDHFRANNCSVPMTVDGATYRLFIAVNGRIPGPTLVVSEDQIVVVNVINKLTSEGITIHWHGMHQQLSPWMDGVAFISQAPIVPGAEFRYIFRARPAGTHWYHSHTGAQRTDGLFGALIVKENDATMRAMRQTLGLFTDNPEHTLTFLDWQRESSLNLFVQIHSTLGFYNNKPIGNVPVGINYPFTSTSNGLYRRTESSDGIEVGPVPYWSGLINGRGRYNSNTNSKLSIFNVAEGNVYRFRLIGAQSLFAYKFSIDRHELTVIASDGHFIRPIDTEFLIIHSGERYDVLINTNQASDNYWIRAETLEEVNPKNVAEGILHYSGARLSVDSRTLYSAAGVVQNYPWNCNQQNPCRAINCPFDVFPVAQYTTCYNLDQLTALMPSDIPQSISPVANDMREVLFFNFGFEGSSSTSAINGRNFRSPVMPYQTNRGGYDQDYSGDSRRSCRQCTNSSPSEQCECTYLKEIATDKTFKSGSDKTIVFVLSAVGSDNNLRFSHPIHLHGHSFNVLDIQHGQYRSNGRLEGKTSDIDCGNDIDLCRNPRWSTSFSPKTYNDAPNQILKDTVIVPAGGYVVIAFQADNPGYWFLHCHIESHQLEGMAVIIREYNESMHNPPPNNINLVGDFTWTVEEFKEKVPSSAQGIFNGLSFSIIALSTLLVNCLCHTVIA